MTNLSVLITVLQDALDYAKDAQQYADAGMYRRAASLVGKAGILAESLSKDIDDIQEYLLKRAVNRGHNT